MKDTFQKEVARLQQKRRVRVFWTRCCLLLALVVAVGTFYVLSQPAKTAEAELICTLEEHTHTEDCYALTLTCPLAEDETHQHTEECYTKTLTCTLEEHVHSADCYALPELKTVELAEQPEDAELAETSTEAVDEVPATEPVESVEPDDAALNGVPDVPSDGPIGTDFGPYITTVKIQRLVDGEYVDATVFENGDSVRVSIEYELPKNIVTPENKYVYYQLPEGISLLEPASGIVYGYGTGPISDSDDTIREVGTYTITVDGLIQITFNDAIATGLAISGKISFSCDLSANDDGSDRNIQFDGQGGSIVVIVPDNQKYDISITKSGDFTDSDYHTAGYHIVVSTEKGTGGEVTITDKLTVATPNTISDPRYVSDSVVLYHVTADGTRTQVSPILPSIAADGHSFEITGLPALAPGEKYDLTYNVTMNSDPDHAGELHNEASAQTASIGANTTYIINYTSDISKQGSFNVSSGLIDWVITINPDGRDVSGWSIHDVLPYPAVGPVYLTTSLGSVFADLTPADGKTIDYTFPAGSPAMTYYIRYSTSVPGSEETVRNDVTLVNENTVTVSGYVSVEEREESVDKKLGSRHVRTDGIVETNWSFTIMLPPTEMTSYSFRDSITAMVTDAETDELVPDANHYGIASQLDQALRGNLHLVSDGKNYYYGDENSIVDFNIVYYSGTTVVPADDSTTRVSRFDVTVTLKNGGTFHGYQIVADDYPTLLDATAATEGDYWTYQNIVRAQNGMYDIAPSFYHKGNIFIKQVLFGSSYTNDDVTVSYSDCEGVLNYRLLIDLTAVTDDAIEVKDHLPAGLALVPGSESANYFNAALNVSYSGNFALDSSFVSTVTENEDGSSDILFQAYNVTEEMRSRYAYLCISYKAKLTDESKWNDYTESNETFTNTSEWEDYTTRQDTTVYNHPKRLEKNGEQLLDVNGNPTSRIRYSVIINAAAEDLDPSSDTLELRDMLTANLDTKLELKNIKLYEYDRIVSNHLGALVPSRDYSLQYNPQTREMVVTVNDEHAYVLVYEYTVNPEDIVAGVSYINNSISLLGSFSSDKRIELQNVDSSASAWQSVVLVEKVDDRNNSDHLCGAQFKLSSRNPDTGEWINIPNSASDTGLYVSDETGRVILTLTGTEKELDAGLLYKLEEVKAPVGYEGSEGVTYFTVKKNANDNDKDVSEAIATGTGIDPDDIVVLPPTGGQLLVENCFKGLTVVKQWLDPKGKDLSDPDRTEITLYLYRSTDLTGATGRELVESEGIVNPAVVTPDADGNWTYTWSAVPEKLPSGEPLYYFVEEAELSGYEPEYPIDGAVPGSIITLKNKMQAFVLPETGSSGIAGYLFMGALILVFTLGFAILLKRRPVADGKNNQ